MENHCSYHISLVRASLCVQTLAENRELFERWIVLSVAVWLSKMFYRTGRIIAFLQSAHFVMFFHFRFSFFLSIYPFLTLIYDYFSCINSFFLLFLLFFPRLRYWNSKDMGMFSYTYLLTVISLTLRTRPKSVQNDRISHKVYNSIST